MQAQAHQLGMAGLRDGPQHSHGRLAGDAAAQLDHDLVRLAAIQAGREVLQHRGRHTARQGIKHVETGWVRRLGRAMLGGILQRGGGKSQNALPQVACSHWISGTTARAHHRLR